MRARAIPLASFLLLSLPGCWLSHERAEPSGEPEIASSASLAIDGSHLYWADRTGERVVRAPRGVGGSVEVLAHAVPALYSPIALTSTDLFWVDSRDLIEVWRVPLGSGASTSERLSFGNAGPIGVAAEAGHVYFSAYDDDTFDLVDIDVATSTSRVVAPGAAALTLVIDGPDLIGTSCEPHGVWRVARDGGERRTITEAYCPITLALHRGDVYFSDYAEPDNPGVGGMGIFRAPASGGAATRVTLTDSIAFAVHRGLLYAVRDGALVQVARDGSATELAPASEVRGVAVDDDFVYWTEDGESGLTLERAPLP